MKTKNKVIIFLITIICILGVFLSIKIYMENNLVEPEEITTDKKYIDVSYEDEQELTNTEIGYLIIEKIDLKAKIKVGRDKETLKNYIGIIGASVSFIGIPLLMKPFLAYSVIAISCFGSSG